MEQNELNEFFRITSVLSEFIKTNKIEGKQYGPQFSAVLKRLMRIQSMKNMKGLLQFNHYINEHEENSMKLQCGTIHCIQCYRELVQDDFYEAGKTQCTCLQILTPIYRRRIIDNFNRIEGLRTDCISCGKRKDNMNFVLKGMHDCLICTECLKGFFAYEKKENQCIICHQIFNEECDTLLRDVIEADMNPAEVRKYYLGDCANCKKSQDTREFIQICEGNKCKVCKTCAESLGKKENEECLCGNRLSVLR